MSYADKLPRPAHGFGRCQVLRDDGERCRRKVKLEVRVFVDPELRDETLNWTTVLTCGQSHDGFWKPPKAKRESRR